MLELFKAENIESETEKKKMRWQKEKKDRRAGKKNEEREAGREGGREGGKGKLFWRPSLNGLI